MSKDLGCIVPCSSHLRASLVPHCWPPSDPLRTPQPLPCAQPLSAEKCPRQPSKPRQMRPSVSRTRDGQRNIEQAAVLGHADGLEVQAEASSKSARDSVSVTFKIPPSEKPPRLKTVRHDLGFAKELLKISIEFRACTSRKEPYSIAAVTTSKDRTNYDEFRLKTP